MRLQYGTCVRCHPHGIIVAGALELIGQQAGPLQRLRASVVRCIAAPSAAATASLSALPSSMDGVDGGDAAGAADTMALAHALLALGGQQTEEAGGDASGTVSIRRCCWARPLCRRSTQCCRHVRATAHRLATGWTVPVPTRPPQSHTQGQFLLFVYKWYDYSYYHHLLYVI